MKKILLVEDFAEKANDIQEFLRTEFPDFMVELSTSYNSAQQKIFDEESHYDLILLDMSMSTYDLTEDVSGGLPAPTAGEDILEGMYLRDITTPVIVVTMYPAFGKKQLTTFDEELKTKFPQNYQSYVFYSSQRNDWKRLLRKKIKNIIRCN